MALNATNPATLAARGARNVERLGSKFTSDSSPPLPDLQASWLARRARLSADRARLYAEQVFGGRAR